MSRINCHSAFKHYEMFHSRGGDVINIGSNNTTIFNCGGHHSGGFWGGFGMGLGNAFGSMFSGGFGMPMFGGFGIGGFGFPSFGGFGNFWSGGNTRNVSDTSNKDCKPCNCNNDDRIAKKNTDYAKLNKLFERKNNILSASEPNLEQLQKLKSDIEALEKDLDGNDDLNDKDYIEQLKRGLDKAIEDAQAKANNAKNVKVAPISSTPTPEEITLPVEASDVAQDNSVAHTYLDGYTNYDGKSELKNGDVIKAHDTSGNTRDTVIINGRTSIITKAENGTHPQTIVIQDSKDITYTYARQENGEYIYTSNQANQEYVLQKHGDKYELVQYEHHKGYGVKDWSADN